MKMKKIITGVLILTMVFLCTGCKKETFSMKVESIIVELGQEMPEDISVYVNASNSVLEKCELDANEVDVHMVGDYTAKIIYNEQEYPFAVVVQDTVAPQTKLLQTVFNVEAGDYIDIEDIFEEIEEEDELIIIFKYDETVLEDEGGLTFDEAGEYKVSAELSDPSENTSVFEFQVNVSELSIPIFEGLTDMVVKAGETPDYLTGVTIADAKDGDLTAKIEVDDSGVDYKENGEYEVYYTVEDSDGNAGEGVRLVKVKGNPEPVDEEEEPEPEEVVDTTIPEIRGARSMTISKGAALPDFKAGVTAYDGKDGDLTASIEVDAGEVEVNEPGEYTVYYSVFDKDDNEGSTSITITVAE